ncbi:MAG: GuaB3 family IMP dehydrogenase-related protein [Mycobacteriales bacterium]
MPDTVEIGAGKAGRRGYHLDDVAIVPTRRTRSSRDVSTTWQIDAFRFDIPVIAHPSDATMSPATVVGFGRLGGLGVLNAEGLWARFEDPAEHLASVPALAEEDLEVFLDDEEPQVEDWPRATRLLQRLYAAPVVPGLIEARVREIREQGVTTAARLSPQHAMTLAPVLLDAGVDILVIQGTIVSAEHVASEREPLNLKEFITDLDVPVIVGGATTYQTALHLMRTGAAGVIVGMGTDRAATTEDVLGIQVPMATAISDAAAARRDYLDETGGRYVHVVADGEIGRSGDLAKAVACGADAVMLGVALTGATGLPGGGAWWESTAAHPTLPRGQVHPVGVSASRGLGDLATIVRGPARDASGRSNLIGGLARAMAKTGFCDLKDFQRVGLTVSGRR